MSLPAPRLGAGRQFSINAFWFATNLHWGVLLAILLPSQMRLVAPGREAPTLGALQGVGALVGLLVPMVVGALSDRCNSRWGRRRPFMVVGVAANLLFLAVLWYAGSRHSLALYAAGFIGVQIANNIAYGAYLGVIPDVAPADQRGVASAWMAAMSTFGTAAGAVGAGWLMRDGRSAESYGLIGLTLVVFLAVTVCSVRERPGGGDRSAIGPLELLRSLWIDPRSNPRFALVWFTRALAMFGVFTVQPFMQYYLRDVLNVPDPEWATGRLLAAIVPGAALGAVLGGWASDRVGRRGVIWLASALLVAGCVGFIGARTLPQAAAVGALFGFGYGAYYSANWALGCDVLPGAENAARDMGIWNAAMMLPQSLGAFAAGPIVAAFGSRVTQSASGAVTHYVVSGYACLFGVAAVSIAAGAALLVLLRGVR